MLVHRRFVTPFDARLARVRSPFDAGMDRAFDQIVQQLSTPVRRSPACRGEWDDDHFVLTVDLPGVPSDRVAVEVTDRVLTVSATLDDGEWSRSLKLGLSLDPERVEARYADGRLTVRVEPVQVAEPEVRRIAITTGTAAVEADAHEHGAIADTPATEADAAD